MRETPNLLQLIEDVGYAAAEQRDDIGDSDLYDEQPVVLQVVTTLGAVRAARAQASREARARGLAARRQRLAGRNPA